MTCKAVAHADKPQSDGSTKETEEDVTRRWATKEASSTRSDKTRAGRLRKANALELKAAENRADSLDAMSPSGYNTQALLQHREDRGRVEQIILNCEQREQEYGDWEAALEEYESWLTYIEDAMDEIVDRGRLHFIVFIEIEGKKVALLRTAPEATP